MQRDSSLADRRKQWKEILPDFERKRKSAGCIALCWRGIPTNLRVHVWQVSLSLALSLPLSLSPPPPSLSPRARVAALSLSPYPSLPLSLLPSLSLDPSVSPPLSLARSLSTCTCGRSVLPAATLLAAAEREGNNLKGVL